MALILNPSQAEAVYSAMCALNNVGGTFSELMIGEHDAIVKRFSDGRIYVFGDDTERYAGQIAFATAYGLNRHPSAHPMTKLVKIPSGTIVSDAGTCGNATATDTVEHGFQIFLSEQYGRLILVDGFFRPSLIAKELRDNAKLEYSDQMISIIEGMYGWHLLSDSAQDQIREIIDNARGLK